MVALHLGVLQAQYFELHQLHLLVCMKLCVGGRNRLMDFLGVSRAERNAVRVQTLLTGKSLPHKSIIRTVECAGERAGARKTIVIVDVKLLSEKLAHLVKVLLVERGLVTRGGCKARDVEGSAGSSGVGGTHGGRAHTASTKAVEEGGTVTGMMSGGHSGISRRVRW